MVYIGLFFSLLIGVVLGLVGGGGSILTVPLVNYFFGETMLIATTYSLFVVTFASGIGVIQRLNSKTIDFRKGLIFALPSMLTAFFIRGYVMPMFPVKFPISGFMLSRDIVILVLLIIVMLYTAIRTLTSKRKHAEGGEVVTPIWVILFFGVLTGILSGFIGAGGGFIIVPILLRMGLDMKRAVGTSMLIICIQSAVALMGDLFNQEIVQADFNWLLLASITVITVMGVFIGTYAQKYLSGNVLRKVFSFILIIVALGMISKFW